MDTTQRIRIAGMCAIIGGAFWLLQTSIQVAFSLDSAAPGSPAFTVGAILATGCLVLVLIGFLGIGWTDGLGGRFGKIVFGVAVLGYGVMVLGGGLTALGVGPLTDSETAVSLIYLLGRLIAVIFTLLTGCAVALARRWQGWTRFAPLLLGLWPIFGELVPVLVTGTQPPALLNGAWGVWVALVGLATLAQIRPLRSRPASAVGLNKEEGYAQLG